MKYYYKYDHFSHCLEDCPNKMLHDNNNIKKIGAWTCKENCENFINISLDNNNNKKYIECKYINNQERLKKLNTI